MTEQNPEQYDPAAYTVDEVNTYLEAADEAERQRVLEAEAARGDDARVGITEGPHAKPAEPQGDGDHAADTRTETTRQAQENGVVGDTAGPDDDHAVKPADESAPEGVDTDAAAGLVIATGDDASRYTGDRPATMADQAAPSLEGEHYQRGYVGDLPGGDSRPDLTLQGVLGKTDTKD